jgi:hypothetical protein
MTKKMQRFEIYPTPGLVEAIDRWRAKQEGLPPEQKPRDGFSCWH